MPVESAVEYSANLRGTNINLVHPKNDAQNNGNGIQETSNDSSDGK